MTLVRFSRGYKTGRLKLHGRLQRELTFVVTGVVAVQAFAFKKRRDFVAKNVVCDDSRVTQQDANCREEENETVLKRRPHS